MRLRHARLIAIEEHYLRAHTDAGSDLVLMRMTDTCALLCCPRGQARAQGRTVSRAMQASLRDQCWG